VGQAESHPTQEVSGDRVQQIRAGMRHVGRRQWWLWSTAVMVTLLLTIGIASFAFPGLLGNTDETFSLNVSIAVRALIGLVLIFNVYTVYQQLQIHRMQSGLLDQMCALDKMEALTEEVYKLAVLDPLTGLHNRRSGEQRLAEEISRAKRHGRPLTVLLLDVDRLKSINDNLGHAAGDDLLKYFAGRVSKAIRGSDLAIRLGGDEFLLVLPECKPEEVQHILGRLQGMNLELAGQALPVTFSAGWTTYIPGELPDELLKRADAALYASKRAVKDKEESDVSAG
jgi:diguanylate cyclase (GGDEF)-like protein